MTDDHPSGLRPGLTHAVALRAMTDMFRDAGLSTPGLEARFLFEAAAGSVGGPTSASLRIDETLCRTLREMVRRRLEGEPVDRIIGNAEFWSRRFDLNAGTLSPRPDTETIVEAALAMLAASPVRNPRILDLGTGTGAILITLLAEYGMASGIGIDAAEAALDMAGQNAVLNGVADRAAFRRGNWTEGLAGPFDLIISNPPYIPSADIAGLDREVRLHDPVLALDGGPDGLEAYRAIAGGAAHLLAAGGRIIFEIGAGQEADVTAIMQQAGFLTLEQRRDLGGHIRALSFGL